MPRSYPRCLQPPARCLPSSTRPRTAPTSSSTICRRTPTRLSWGVRSSAATWRPTTRSASRPRWRPTMRARCVAGQKACLTVGAAVPPVVACGVGLPGEAGARLSGRHVSHLASSLFAASTTCFMPCNQSCSLSALRHDASRPARHHTPHLFAAPAFAPTHHAPAQHQACAARPPTPAGFLTPVYQIHATNCSQQPPAS